MADSRQIFKPSFLGGKLIPKDAFVKHKLSNQICPTGTKTEGGHLMPELRCNDKFTIEYNWTKQTTMLRLIKTDEIFNDYSLYVHDDETYSALVCRASTDIPAKDWKTQNYYIVIFIFIIIRA